MKHLTEKQIRQVLIEVFEVPPLRRQSGEFLGLNRIAVEAGVGYTTLRNIINGQPPHWHTLERVSAAFQRLGPMLGERAPPSLPGFLAGLAAPQHKSTAPQQSQPVTSPPIVKHVRFR